MSPAGPGSGPPRPASSAGRPSGWARRGPTPPPSTPMRPRSSPPAASSTSGATSPPGSDTLADLGIDDNEPALTAVEKQATVADLRPAPSAITTTGDFNTLGTILEHAAGTSLFED